MRRSLPTALASWCVRRACAPTPVAPGSRLPDAAQQLLQQLGELLFRKEPALVPQFSAALLELQVRAGAMRRCGAAPGFLTSVQAEPAGAVRKFLASVLDALAGSSVHLVAPCAAAAICLIRVRSPAHF